MPSFSTSNFVEGDTAVQPGGVVAVSNAASGLLLAANGNRVAAVLVNDDATNIVYLSLGGTAVVGSGIRLNANGGSFVCDFYTGAINARSAVAPCNVGVTEV